MNYDGKGALINTAITMRELVNAGVLLDVHLIPLLLSYCKGSNKNSQIVFSLRYFTC
ncbi:hypothetical protein ES705_26632 [subsurface metagenome]